MILKVYIYDIQNPDAITNGEDPQYEEVRILVHLKKSLKGTTELDFPFMKMLVNNFHNHCCDHKTAEDSFFDIYYFSCMYHRHISYHSDIPKWSSEISVSSESLRTTLRTLTEFNEGSSEAFGYSEVIFGIFRDLS